jgi:hypothetical protein
MLHPISPSMEVGDDQTDETERVEDGGAIPTEIGIDLSLKSPHRVFLLLRLDVVHHCCCASTFHDLPMATIEVDETWLVGPSPAWVRLVEPPSVEDSPGWALLAY